VVSDSIGGETRFVGPSTLTVQIPVRLDPLTNVKLLISVCHETHCFSDVYAKVSSVEDQSGQPLHHLDITYMDQADKIFLYRCIDVAEPRGEEFIWP
jgi:hypothetical protein